MFDEMMQFTDSEKIWESLGFCQIFDSDESPFRLDQVQAVKIFNIHVLWLWLWQTNLLLAACSQIRWFDCDYPVIMGPKSDRLFDGNALTRSGSQTKLLGTMN